ncbi:fungal-specific transcription factor domain-containing protein [Phaeosphaeria sp. MPI-PUGE-AT-0046c]|nr:fungal-specific transcription factor domain-containing protein [Phaeosphaeria sp. MPI-PUGE-AT-0046c]
MYDNAHDSSGPKRGAKVAIPRLDRGPPPPPVPKPIARNRDDQSEPVKLVESEVRFALVVISTTSATYRFTEIKCTGDGPPCSACQASSLECSYEQARRDRLREATQQNAALSALLRNLSGRVNAEDQTRIDVALADIQSSAQNTLGKHARGRSDSDEESSTTFGEARVTASVGSNEDLDYLDENLSRDRESRETGYFGQNSEVQWLSSVQRQTARLGKGPPGQPHGPPGFGSDAIAKRVDALHKRQNQAMETRQVPSNYITDSTFYLDSDELRFDIVVDTDEIPPADVAERLFSSYMETVHPVFPLVPDDFADKFRLYMNTSHGSEDFPPVWRAQLNLIFAIGAKYSHLMDAEWTTDNRDHFVYMKRAVNLLELKDTLAILSGPDIPLVQTTGTLAFYFLAIGHVSRAWITIGMSLRLALALGLHLRNENPTASNSSKETLVRLWWTLHAIESLLSAITGRPPVLAIEDSTVPLPKSLTEFQPTTSVHNLQGPSEQSSFGARAGVQSTPNLRAGSVQSHRFLIDHVNVMRILQKALLELYSPRTASQSWQIIQRRMSGLLSQIDTWSHAVSSDDFLAHRREQGPSLDRLRRLLVIEYWSIKMVITRPCLCRLERRIRNESNNSTQFNTTIAKTCVESALEMVKLFPDKADLQFIAMNFPWWANTHYIVQAVAVLLLETSYEKRDHGKTTPDIIEAIKKMLRWLRVMEDNDPVAAKAYRVVRRILKAVAPILQTTADELLRQDDPYHTPVEAGSSFAGPTFNLQSVQQDEPVFTPSLHPNMMFDPETFLHQPQGGMAASSHNPSVYSEPHFENQFPIGNPFITEFDQYAPFANLQDLWTDTLAPESLDPDSPDLSNTWGDSRQNFDTEMDDGSQPQ